MLQAAIREGQQRSIQGVLGVLQYGIVPVDVLHYFRVELVLLRGGGGGGEGFNFLYLKTPTRQRKLVGGRSGVGGGVYCGGGGAGGWGI